MQLTIIQDSGNTVPTELQINWKCNAPDNSAQLEDKWCYKIITMNSGNFGD